MSLIPFQMGFTAVNWSFLEAGHGKGPADGVGATIKRTADSQVARGTDIPTAKALYETLLPLTKVKLIYVEEEQISRVSALLPKELPTIKGTLSMHQVICSTPGTIHYRVLSCFCNREALCPCFHPSSTNIAPQAQPERDATTPTSVAPEDAQQGSHCTSNSGRDETLCPVDDVTEVLVGKWCVVTYDNKPYPGIIEDVEEGDSFPSEISSYITCYV